MHLTCTSTSTAAAAAALLACALASPAWAQAAAAATACNDFDAHVNGHWAASTELPADRGRIGSFDTLRTTNDRLLESALAELAAEPARQTTPGLKLLAAYYRSGMDEAGIEKRGLAALAPQLAAVDALRREDLESTLGRMARVLPGAPFQLNVAIDARDATRHVLSIAQAGLGLPDREDYFRKDANSQRLLGAYRVYARRLLQASGTDASEASLDALLALASWPGPR